MAELILPKDYQNRLSVLETMRGIKLIKDYFETSLKTALNLTRISAPMFVDSKSGLNDNLNGVERPVTFDIPFANVEVEIVHSLAKWKRSALKRYGLAPGEGIYTDMNAIRRDEELDNLHSVYVDQWDWELILTREDRTLATLKAIVEKIYHSILETQRFICNTFPALNQFLPESITFITTQELEDRYPNLSAKERENKAAEEYGAYFLMQIGGKLRSGKPHDGRAPDYDDWSMNGDIIVYDPILDRSFELSSMGIRVDEAALRAQLKEAACEHRLTLPFHQQLVNGNLPLTIGGGIGQSRLCMLLLNKAHIGEVQASIWPAEMIESCSQAGITLL